MRPGAPRAVAVGVEALVMGSVLPELVDAGGLALFAWLIWRLQQRQADALDKIAASLAVLHDRATGTR